jgi:hypothetical protein
MLILGTSTASAFEIEREPVGKIINPGIVFVEFDNIHYRLFTPVAIRMTLEKVDSANHKIVIYPLEMGYESGSVWLQWELFSPAELEIDSGGNNRWLIGTETGYAEK